MKSHRDLMTFVNGENMQTFVLEMATCGFSLVHCGQLALSVPMTDENIDEFINISKEIIEEML